MNSYLTFQFCMHIFTIVLYLGFLIFSRYPRIERVSMGIDVAIVLLGIGMLTWVSILKFGGCG